ncbi:MAG TPA: BamA/TamA family outer membrane protein, partial [Saprospiraceae bacterium]|nr:BamA/TamA family outer membrane protein [Saprospiraceae bacterium]
FRGELVMKNGSSFILFSLLAVNLFGQDPAKLALWLDDHPVISIHRTKDEAANRLLQVIDSFQTQGYLACHYEVLVESDTLLEVRLQAGSKYVWAKVDMSGIPLPFLINSGILRRKDVDQDWNLAQCRSVMQQLAAHLAEEGYPYAVVFLDSTRLEEQRINARMNLVTGPRVTLDTLEWDDGLKISPSLLLRILGIQSGSPFNKKKIDQGVQALAAYSFVEPYADPDITLSRGLARVRLYLRTRRTSQVDALIGILPSSERGGKLKFNGNFRADLLNQLGRGERFTFDFQSLQSSSQELRIRAGAPFLFQLPFHPFFQFNLYRRDSLFLDVFAELGATLPVGERGEIRFFIGQKSSSLLSPDLRQILISHRLPDALDLRLNHLGAALRFRRLDFERNPRRGYSFSLYAHGASRKIIPNSSITSLRDPADSSFSFAGLYDQVKKNGYAFDVQVEAEKYTVLGRYGTWHSWLRAASRQASGLLQLNERWRLGGFKLLRGFDEESIFASAYSMWTNEARLLTGEWSYIQVFSDLALVNQYTGEQYQNAVFWGLGAGLTFNTSLGNLSVSAAAGRRFPASFDLRGIKLHIGYLTVF